MLLLVTKSHPELDRLAHPHVGRLLQPRHTSSAHATADAGIPWAADNDCFNGFDLYRFTAMLGKLANLPGCRFVAVPDVVGEADTTIRMYHHWHHYLRLYGLPLALVLQDGMTIDTVPWDIIDAVFVGGSTSWKLGADAAAIVGQANALGKWAHMGRVNSERRMAYAASIGCDSVDGSGWARFSNAHLARGARAASTPTQLRLVP